MEALVLGINLVHSFASYVREKLITETWKPYPLQRPFTFRIQGSTPNSKQTSFKGFGVCLCLSS